MANEIETTTEKKLFDRWKDNFKDFFIEDDKKKETKNKEEKENLIEANGEQTHVEPVDKVMEKAEEKMIEHLSPGLTSGKEDLEGIPEVEEEDTVEETQEDGEKTNRDVEVVENGVHQDENITDVADPAEGGADHGEDGTDIDSNEESFLIKEAVEENANTNQNSKTPFFKILANFPFMKKKVSEEQTAVEPVTPVESLDKDDKSNGLPSYNEAVNQQEGSTENEKDAVKEDTNMECDQLPNGKSHADDGTDVANEENEQKPEISPPEESSELNNGDIEEEDEKIEHKEEETVSNGNVEDIQENGDVNQVVEEPKQEEKKFRFRFQFFTDKK